MNPKQILIGGAAVALIGLASPAAADNIVSNVWYSASFGATGSPLSGPPFALGTSPSAIAAPTGTTWTITLAKPEELFITDVETSGDRFEIFDNGVELGLTSVPVPDAANVGECISCAIANPDFSRGEWLLPAGVNVISGTQLGVINFGDADFAVGVPEPAAWALILVGFGGLGAALRMRSRKAAPA